MRIWFQKHTVEGRLPLLDDAYRRHFSAITGTDTEIHIESLPAETYADSLPEGYVRYGAAEAMFGWFFGASAVLAEEAGYDAYVIGTSQDPGLQEARALAAIPVLAYGETAFFSCARRGLRFGIVGFIPELEEPIAENVERYGLSRWLAGFEYMPGGADTMRQALSGDSTELIGQFTESARALIARGARAIIPGEGLPNEVLVEADVRSIDGVPVVDANGLVVTSAIRLVTEARLGVFPAAQHGYQHRVLPEDERRRLFSIFSPSAMRSP